jgi:hypothetical protein
MARKRALTLEQVERMKSRAVRFVQDVLGDLDRAAEIEAESPEAYAERKGVEINPILTVRTIRVQDRRLRTMAQGPTKAELEQMVDEVADLANEALDPSLTREEVIDKVKAIADLVGDEDEEEEEEEGEGEEEEGEEGEQD